MMTVLPYIQLPEVVPQQDIMDLKKKARSKNYGCPPEVTAFIIGLADALGDFAPFQRNVVMMKGSELLLTGIKEIKGERVMDFTSYPLEVPVLQYVDHYSTLQRQYIRYGKQGLIDFCKNKVKGTMLETVLEKMNVYVFHEHSPQFNQALAEMKTIKPE